NYMAPEQAAGQVQQVGPLSDVYALGAILYECLTGRPPFQAASVLETLEQVRSQEPVPPRRLQPAVPGDLETICLKCLAKEPRKRYGTAQDLADDLRRFQAHEPIRARPVGPAERAAKWVKRRPASAALVAVCVLAAAGAGAAEVRYTAGLRDERNRARDERDNARRERAEADRQRELAEGRERLVRRHWDVSRSRQGGIAWRAGAVGHMLEVGGGQRPPPGEKDLRGFEWDYLRRLSQAELLTIRTHTRGFGPYYGDRLVAFSPDGWYLASGSDGGQGPRVEFFVTVW